MSISELHLNIGTRGSKLALWQAEETARLLAAVPSCSTTIVPIKTKGDVQADAPFGRPGDKGLFTGEIETALLKGEVDLAVHSLKDLPYALPEGLVLAAFLKREEPNDVLISKDGLELQALPQGATIGTSSLRRSAQLRRLRPDLVIVPLRGNVQTRIEKLQREGLDATVLASAGIRRLGMTDAVTQVLGTEDMLPAPGQGIIAIETREDAPFLSLLREACNDENTETEALAERAFLGVLEGGCQIPMAAYAKRTGDSLIVKGRVFSEDGQICYEECIKANAGDAVQTGELVAKSLLRQGADRLLAAVGTGSKE